MEVQMQHKTEKIMTVNEVSQLLSIKPGTIYRLARDNKLPTISIGKIRRFSESDIFDWIETQKNNVVTV